MAQGIPARLTPAEGRRFGWQVGLAFLLLAGLSRWRGHTVAPLVLLAPGLTLVVAALLLPGRLSGVYRAWMRLALAISRVTTPILMGLIYFLVITPTGLLQRLFGRGPLRRPRTSATYWVRRADQSHARGDLRRQF